MFHTFQLGQSRVGLDTEHDLVQVTNSVGEFVWGMHIDGLDTESIVARLMHRYRVGAERATSDVEQTLAELKNREAGRFARPEVYVPDTSFVPDRDCDAREEANWFLPGANIFIRSELVGLVERLEPLFPLPASVSSLATTEVSDIRFDIFRFGDQYAIMCNDIAVDTGSSLDDVVFKLVPNIAAMVAWSSKHTIVLHASAVARHRKGIIFPAGCGSGKTTLSAYLSTVGFQFLGDDILPLGRDNMNLLPVPAPLSIKDGSVPVLADRFSGLETLPGLGPASRRVRYVSAPLDAIRTAPVACAAVVVPHYCATLAQADMCPMAPEVLFEHIVASGCLMQRPFQQDQIATLTKWMNEVPAYRLEYSQLDEAERMLISLVH